MYRITMHVFFLFIIVLGVNDLNFAYKILLSEKSIADLFGMRGGLLYWIIVFRQKISRTTAMSSLTCDILPSLFETTFLG